MNSQEKNAIDFITGLGFSGSKFSDLQVSKKQISGNYDNDNLDVGGKFRIQTNKKGRVKSFEMSFAYDWGGYAQLEWRKIKEKKFTKNVKRGKYKDKYDDGLADFRKGDVQGWINEWESIPGGGDIFMWGYNNGQYISFD